MIATSTKKLQPNAMLEIAHTTDTSVVRIAAPNLLINTEVWRPHELSYSGLIERVSFLKCNRRICSTANGNRATPFTSFK